MKITGAILFVLAMVPLCHGAERRDATGTTGKIHLRIWKLELPGVETIRVESRLATGGASHEIVTLGRGYRFDNYVELPAGHMRVSCTILGQKEPFAVLSPEVKGEAYFTLLFKPPQSSEATPGTELINDTIVEPPPAPGSSPSQVRFCVYNFAPNLHDLRITAGSELAFGFEGTGSHLLLEGLKPGKYEIRTTGKDATGVPFEWTNVGNFEESPRQTLLIYPDPYGRIRPMMHVDGPK